MQKVQFVIIQFLMITKKILESSNNGMSWHFGKWPSLGLSTTLWRSRLRKCQFFLFMKTQSVYIYCKYWLPSTRSLKVILVAQAGLSFEMIILLTEYCTLGINTYKKISLEASRRSLDSNLTKSYITKNSINRDKVLSTLKKIHPYDIWWSKSQCLSDTWRLV